MANKPLKIIQNSQKQMPCNIEAEQALIGSILVCIGSKNFCASIISEISS